MGSDPRALDSIATLLSALPRITDSGSGKSFYIVVYSGDTTQSAATRDAWLYAATSTQSDGFDFAENTSAATRDTDTLELIAIFKGIGTNAFDSQHFI